MDKGTKSRATAKVGLNQSTVPNVMVNIRPGPVTPHQRAIWKKWWAARIAEVKQSEAKNG